MCAGRGGNSGPGLYFGFLESRAKYLTLLGMLFPACSEVILVSVRR